MATLISQLTTSANIKANSISKDSPNEPMNNYGLPNILPNQSFENIFNQKGGNELKIDTNSSPNKDINRSNKDSTKGAFENHKTNNRSKTEPKGEEKFSTASSSTSSKEPTDRFEKVEEEDNTVSSSQEQAKDSLQEVTIENDTSPIPFLPTTKIEEMIPGQDEISLDTIEASPEISDSNKSGDSIAYSIPKESIPNIAKNEPRGKDNEFKVVDNNLNKDIVINEPSSEQLLNNDMPNKDQPHEALEKSPLDNFRAMLPKEAMVTQGDQLPKEVEVNGEINQKNIQNTSGFQLDDPKDDIQTTTTASQIVQQESKAAEQTIDENPIAFEASVKKVEINNIPLEANVENVEEEFQPQPNLEEVIASNNHENDQNLLVIKESPERKEQNVSTQDFLESIDPTDMQERPIEAYQEASNAGSPMPAVKPDIKIKALNLIIQSDDLTGPIILNLKGEAINLNSSIINKLQPKNKVENLKFKALIKKPEFQISASIQKMLLTGQTKMKFEMSPKELGFMEIELDINKETGEVTAIVRVENPKTLEYLRSHREEFIKSFNHENYLLQDSNLSFDQHKSSNKEQEVYEEIKELNTIANEKLEQIKRIYIPTTIYKYNMVI